MVYCVLFSLNWSSITNTSKLFAKFRLILTGRLFQIYSSTKIRTSFDSNSTTLLNSKKEFYGPLTKMNSFRKLHKRRELVDGMRSQKSYSLTQIVMCSNLPNTVVKDGSIISTARRTKENGLMSKTTKYYPT